MFRDKWQFVQFKKFDSLAQASVYIFVRRNK